MPSATDIRPARQRRYPQSRVGDLRLQPGIGVLPQRGERAVMRQRLVPRSLRFVQLAQSLVYGGQERAVDVGAVQQRCPEEPLVGRDRRIRLAAEVERTREKGRVADRAVFLVGGAKLGLRLVV